MDPDLTGPFRGTAAIAAGLLTPGVLRNARRYRRLFPDVYAPADLDVDLALRASAAGVLVSGRGVVAGWSAAELLGASCGPPDAPAEVLLTAPRSQSYRCAGLLVHRDRLGPDETASVAGTRVTTAARTAYDLARWAPSLTERVVAVDTLAYCCGVDADDVVELRHRHLGAQGNGDLHDVLRLSDRRSESPMESRTRVALVLAGLPPEVQYPVVVGRRRYRLDLAYPHHKIAIEYDGTHHRGQRRARLDLEREAALTAAGWRILRFDAYVVLFRPDRIVTEVRAELAA